MARRVSPSTQNQALSALLFLYRHVLGCELPDIGPFDRARRRPTVPAVLSRDEVNLLLKQLSGTPLLVTKLLYGGGLRLLETLGLRVKDVDFERSQLLVRRGKGGVDRVTLLPRSASRRLRAHLEYVRHLHQQDVTKGFGHVVLPGLLLPRQHSGRCH